jgi:hypothetical protein
MSSSSSNVTSGFIDLATYDELEKYMYGGMDATAYFVRETRKSTWFTQVPVVLSRASGTPGFDTDWSVQISRAGDYLLNTWLRVTFPELTVVGGGNKICWTPNLMHNLIKEASITFNDLVAARFDNYFLDFWTAFTVPASKRDGYDHMIGNNGSLTKLATSLPKTTLNLPLPFFFSRDSGVALPTAAIPYNDMRINFTFRKWEELLNFSNGGITIVPAVSTNVTTTPTLDSNTQVWANYAIVSNDERKKMACAPRDILIEQVQTAPRFTGYATSNSSPSYDIRFSQAVKVLFFAARNTTNGGSSNASLWSNYTNAVFIGNVGTGILTSTIQVDPIATTSLVYENTNRLASMGSDFFSLVDPWYHAPTIPSPSLLPGYHMYSYSLDFYNLDPMGSTNYGKLTNVSLQPTVPTAFNLNSSSYEFIVTAVNNNIVRISGGALGFPVL